MVATAIALQLHAQKNWIYNAHANVGATIQLTGINQKAQRFPGFRLYAGFHTSALRGDLQLNYGPAISIYTKSIGANLNPLIGDIQIDFSHSFSAGIGFGGQDDHIKMLRSMHTGDYYNLVTGYKNMIALGTNLILNNNARNQVSGFVTTTFSDLSFMYYNDGSPFHIIGLGDDFDRYWTGGGSIFFHNDKGYNNVEFSFDQFTGYTPLMYELANILGINVPLYERKDGAKRNGKPYPYTHNTSQYHLRIATDKNVAVHAGVVGSLVFDGKYWGIQDLIHRALNMPFHPNNDINRIFIGGSYQINKRVKY